MHNETMERQRQEQVVRISKMMARWEEINQELQEEKIQVHGLRMRAIEAEEALTSSNRQRTQERETLSEELQSCQNQVQKLEADIP